MHAADDELPWPRAGGLLLGRYELLGVIGRGGMGVVSRARDVQSGRLVAVKRVRAEGARAEREALASARLRHPAIVELLEAEATDQGWIIVSELVEGADLRAVLRTGEVPELDIARFAGSIVRGLAHAHQHGVIHRDVKPANILCPADPRRSGAWAKLTDFGVAALAGAETLTAVGDVVGTMAYMAPEQARGDRAGAPADVFALAVVVYEALAGINPRRGSTAAETAHRALTSVPPLARHRPDLPSAIHGAIDHCLELDPDHRGGLLELDEGLKRLAALASGKPMPRDAAAPTSVTRLVDRRAAAAHPPMAPPPDDAHVTAHRGVPAAAPHDGHDGRPHDPPHQPTMHRAPDQRPYVPPPGQVDPRADDGALVPYLPPPGHHQPVVGPHGRAHEDDDLGPRGWAGDAVARPDDGAPGWPEPVATRGRLPRVPLRLLGTAGAAAALFVITDNASGPVALAAIALAAFVLPRMTWFAIAVAACALLASRDETAAGLAAIAGVAPALLLPRRGELWPASGLAAGLAAISAPAAWPALAALAPRATLRIALALHGALVVAVVALATDVPLLNVPPGDVAEVATRFVLPLAGIWVVASVLLGIVVRGRTLGADCVAAAAWTSAVGFAMVGADIASADALLWAGPAASSAIVVVVRAVARDRELSRQAPLL
jgi:serine/threonine protein kinase